MKTDAAHWEMIIIDGAKYAAFDHRLVDLVVGDFDGDGYTEVLTHSTWYRMATGERGHLAQRLAFENVQPTVGDLDGDGRLEIISSRQSRDDERLWPLVWYKPTGDLDGLWMEHVLSPDHMAQPHDIIVADVDGDGQNEVVAVGVYGYPAATQGLYIYKPEGDITAPWARTTLQTGLFADGTAAADVDGDGIMEIVSGPYLYAAPPEGPFSGKPWTAWQIAPSFRTLCRAIAEDITGNGRPDIVIVEAEYPDCKMSWFENRILQDPQHPWIEHPLLDGLKASHTLDSWRDQDGSLHIVVAETENGTGPLINHDARILEFVPTDGGRSWSCNEIYRGQGTWMGHAVDVDDDGEVEILGATDCAFACFGVQVWKKGPASITLNLQHRFVEREKPHPATDILAADVDGDGREDIVTGEWWYRAPDWQRYAIPGVYQVVSACDIDGDGRMELLATKPRATPEGPIGDWAKFLSNELVWVKPVDPVDGEWTEYAIASLETEGKGPWTHAQLIPDLLGASQDALVTHCGGPHQLFPVPPTPSGAWEGRVLPEAAGCVPGLLSVDLTGNGLPDLFGCWKWLENLGDGQFRPHTVMPRFDAETRPDGWRGTGQALMDVNGNGRLDLVACEDAEVGTPYTKEGNYTRLAWFEQPEDPRQGPWKMHTIDHLRSPNSVLVCDIDGDGEDEIIVGEHDPRIEIYYLHRRLFVYKKAEPNGRFWTRHVIEDRFDHNAGVKSIRFPNGRLGIISHGMRSSPDHWLARDSMWTHLWEPAG